jgi:hypothetical protein
MSHSSCKNRETELVANANVLELQPLLGAWRVGWLMGMLVALMVTATVGVIWTLGVITLSDGAWWGVGFFLVSLPFVWLADLMYRSLLFGAGPPRFRFDQARGELIIDRRHGLKKGFEVTSVRPLSDIISVQLLHSGFHSLSHTSEHGPSLSEQFHNYEMNLLFGDHEATRLHLCTHSDWQWMRDAGRRLADFLGVPLVDQLYHGE